MPDCANAATVFEGAENGFAGITVHASSGYNFISSTISADPPFHSFHFTHPGFAEQWMTLNNVVVPQFNTVLRFKSMLRSATPDQAACVQISNNGGAMWIDVFAQAGDGTAGEATFSDRLVSLGALAGQVVRIRFLYALTGGSGLTQTTDSFGWFVDQITVVSGAIILFEGAENGLAGVSVQVPGVARNLNVRDLPCA